MGLIHKTCLETWFRTSNSNECEICHFKYTVQCEKRSFCEVIKRTTVVLKKQKVPCFSLLSLKVA